jgi:hypothetical protein
MQGEDGDWDGASVEIAVRAALRLATTTTTAAISAKARFSRTVRIQLAGASIDFHPSSPVWLEFCTE